MKRSKTNRSTIGARTLSSSIRQYRQWSRKQTNRDTNGNESLIDPSVPDYGTLPRSVSPRDFAEEPEQAEHQNLLSSQHSLHDATIDDDNHQGDENEDEDEEAQQSEQADSDGLYPPNCTWTNDGEIPKKADPFRNSECSVWIKIHEVRRIIINSIDDPYSLEQLKAPRMNVSVVRPLVDRFYNMQDLSIVYCLLTNRFQFIREQSYATHHQTVNLTRALLCELLAEKVLRRYNEHNPGPLGLLKLANILVAGFDPFQGAPDDAIEQSNSATMYGRKRKTKSFERKMNALELAIVSESKSFLASTACQNVVDAIYRGRIVYSPNSFMDIIPDHWKRRPVSLYDPRRAPLLNQYRLIVPRTRNLIEVVQFVILLVLYIVVMTGRETWKTTKYDLLEAIFDIYAAGWVLDQIASILEHGWQVYTQNLWSFLDVIFALQFVAYLTLRMHGLRVDDTNNPDIMPWSRTALDILSCAAPILVPRLAFNVMSDNMLFLSLRAMMGDFLTLSALALWCFAGFLFSLKWLHDGVHEPEEIGKWMIWIWFGLDGTGIEQAPDFHWLLGPALMITFAFLGNTLFLTILVSMLSNTFSMITSNAVQEIQYRRSVLTFMGVKSDAIFAYMPPFNLPALLIMLPLKFLISPRAFHSLNVVAVRILNMPLLILISLYERQSLWVPERRQHYQPRKIDWRDPNGPRALNAAWWAKPFQTWDFSGFSVHADIQAVFSEIPPNSWLRQYDNDDDEHPMFGIHKNRIAIPEVDHTLGFKTAGLQSVQRKPRTKGVVKHMFRESPLKKKRVLMQRNNPMANHPSMTSIHQQHKRKDSMSDFEGHEGSSYETNMRLARLDEALERIQSYLEQIFESDSDDESHTNQELRVDAEIERV